MNKLQMAHEFAMKLVGNPTTPLKDMDSIIAASWRYADAMQAEADEREKEKQDKAKQEQQNYEDAIDSIGVEEWQPDWSQAPKGFNRFVVGSDGGCGFFTNMEPQLQDDFWFVGADGIVIKDHGYQGNWKDSLRKRP